MSSKGSSPNRRILVALAVVITIAWVASLILDAKGVWADPPETIGLAFMAMLSTVLGLAARDGLSNNGPEQKRDSREEEEE